MDESKEEFIWSGEGKIDVPRVLTEDTVEYSMYIIDATLRDSDVREKLREIQSAATKLTKHHLSDFIWQRDSFQLKLERENDRSFLRGHTNYADSIDDEWLIVFLLRELAKQFPQVWIRVVDSDGQFLLIEAANVLPIWLNPEIADFRVWMNQDQLLIIPVDSPGGKSRRLELETDSLDLPAALNFIQDTSSGMLHSTKIQDEAFYRLQKYPQAIADNFHHALARVPRNLAYILHENPACISPAVEAFYLRDPIAMRRLQSKDTGKLTFPPSDFVTLSIKFTKAGFAQVTGQTWSAPVSWKSASSAKGDARAKAYAELGMKIACGFEMLVSDPQNKDHKAVREISMLLEDIVAGEVSLPSEEEVRGWSMREDDQKWLDVNFADFEKELSGELGSGLPTGGFGDKGTQDHLRKLVSRFQDILKEDDITAERADFLDDLESDGSSEIGSSDPEDVEDLHGEAFDEDDFTKMMREMLGMPSEVMREAMGNTKVTALEQENTEMAANSSTEKESSAVRTQKGLSRHDILKAMDETEQELREAGALNLETSDLPAIGSSQHKALGSLNPHRKDESS